MAKRDANSFELFTRNLLGSEIVGSVNYVQVGVLGDLCLSRVNKEIFEYNEGKKDHPFGKIFMCDLVKISSKGVFLYELYLKCKGYNHVSEYFTEKFLLELESRLLIDGERINDSSKKYEALVKSVLRDKKNAVLTNLGKFVVDNYRATGTEDERRALFSESPPNESTWIFYLAMSPIGYDKFITSITNYFFHDSKKSTPNSKKLVLLEKPFALNKESASVLAKKLVGINKKFRDIEFFAVDHYAAKWAISQIPVLMQSTPSFKNFIDSADTIIIELLESQVTPEYRYPYMASAGLFNDMMPHILVPLQYMFARQGKKIQIMVQSTCLVKGSYSGYSKSLIAWNSQNSKSGNIELKDDELKDDTYFSLELNLALENTSIPKKPKEVKVYIRSGKGMVSDRKRIIVKKTGTGIRPNNGTLTIDIANDKFHADQHSGISFPPAITANTTPKKSIRGYAKILYDVMEYCTSGKVGSEPSMELVTVMDAVDIIGNIEHIYDQINFENAKTVLYETSTHLVIDEKVESMFLHPFE